jgi:ATP-dependent DNA helicase PIF1
MLAFAITVHQSQGLTLDDVVIDLNNCFAPGQAYVAMSRCKSLERMHLLNFKPSYIYSDRVAVKFDSQQ